MTKGQGYDAGMSAEATQEQGRRSVARTKRWLEATTYVELPFNVYENDALCEIELLEGTKRFDMYGFMLGDNRREVYVENKDYSAERDQYRQFQEFLATAYSATARRLKSASDRKTEFMWVTTHPFKMSRWSGLGSHTEMNDALARNTHLLGGSAVDEALARLVASRVWVLVVNQRQVEISLTHEEVGQVLTMLGRKKPSL